MTEAAYNLVTITGNKDELDRLEKIAYKNESEAFNLDNFINYSGNSTTANKAVFGTAWVAFGILIEKTENSLKYYFNSEWNAANLRFIVDRFPDLEFKHVYVEIASEKVGVIHYNPQKRLESDNFEYWDCPCPPYTYNYIEDVALKSEYLISKNKKDITEKHFFENIDRDGFIKNHSQEYETIFKNTIELEKQDLHYARYGTYYSLIAHEKKDLEQFIRAYFQIDKQTELLAQLNGVDFDISKVRRWWNCLSQDWKHHLVDCLIYFDPLYTKEGYDLVFQTLIKSIQESDVHLKDILELENLAIPLPLIFDNLGTILDSLSKLKNIELHLNGYDDFISTPASLDEIIEHLPESVFSKVTKIAVNVLQIEDATILSRFPNLEVFNGQGTYLETLKGIEKSVNLKSFTADQGNFYTSIVPLKNLQLEYLNIQFAGVRLSEPFASVIDLKPLLNMHSLKSLFTGGCIINDYNILFSLPNLTYLETSDFKQISGVTNQEFKFNLKSYLVGMNQFSPDKAEFKDSNLRLDKNKTWYLSPIDYLGTFGFEIEEGKELTDENWEYDVTEDEFITRLLVIDSTEILNGVSEELIYPVEIDTDLPYLTVDEHSAYVQSLKLGEPIRLTELINKMVTTEFSETITLIEISLTDEIVLPKEFNGNLILFKCYFRDGFELPKIINGSLNIVSPTIEGKLKISEADRYNFKFIKESELAKMDAGEEVMSEILKDNSGEVEELEGEDDLPFLRNFMIWYRKIIAGVSYKRISCQK